MESVVSNWSEGVECYEAPRQTRSQFLRTLDEDLSSSGLNQREAGAAYSTRLCLSAALMIHMMDTIHQFVINVHLIQYAPHRCARVLHWIAKITGDARGTSDRAMGQYHPWL